MNLITIKSKKNISLLIILFVNFIFSIKYLNRYTSYFLILAIIIFVLQLLLFRKGPVLIDVLKTINISSLFSLLLISSVFLFIASKVSIESLNIDRWSIITSFWDSFFNSSYVYKAKSFAGNYPGPMPFYFFLMLPFYLIKEYSYVTVIGVFLLYFSLKPEKSKYRYVLLIISSITFFYEVLTRSNIFFNSTLILLSLNFFLNNKKNTAFKGIIIGLFLSTRNIFVIVYGIAFIYALISKLYSFKDLLKTGSIAALVFVATFLPFMYNHFDEFWQMNPFIIQSSELMPASLSFLCITTSLIFGLFAKAKGDVYFLSGITLFITILMYFLYQSINTDFNTAFWKNGADITYFIFCIPFFLYYLHKPMLQNNI